MRFRHAVADREVGNGHACYDDYSEAVARADLTSAVDIDGLAVASRSEKLGLTIMGRHGGTMPAPRKKADTFGSAPSRAMI
jgi:hypothetical protein